MKLEFWLPLIAAFIVLATSLVSELPKLSSDPVVTALYGAVSTWLSVTSGFLLASHAHFVNPTGRLAGVLEANGQLANIESYAFNAFILSLSSIILTLILLVIQLKPIGVQSSFVFAVWIGLIVRNLLDVFKIAILGHLIVKGRR